MYNHLLPKLFVTYLDWDGRGAEKGWGSLPNFFVFFHYNQFCRVVDSNFLEHAPKTTLLFDHLFFISILLTNHTQLGTYYQCNLLEKLKMCIWPDIYCKSLTRNCAEGYSDKNLGSSTSEGSTAGSAI